MAARKKKRQPGRMRGRKRTKSSRRSGCSPTVHPDWRQLIGEFPDHPALKDETVYALPDALLDAIDQEVPDFLSSEDEHFERRLTRLGRQGFFLQQPFHFDPLDRPRSTNHEERKEKSEADANEWEERWKKSDERVRAALAEELRNSGRTQQEIERYFQRPQEFEQRMQVRRDGYAGWLVTNPQFRRERDRFCERWSERIRRRGDLPIVPISLMGGSPPAIPREDRGFYGDYMSFYGRWGLESLATWELPVPLRAEFLDFSLYDLYSVSEAGATVFVPFYLLRDRDLSLYDVAHHRELLQPLDHLDGWMGGKRGYWGPERFALMYQLYRFLELGIRRRYGHRLRGKVAKLDLAFARFWKGLDADLLRVDAKAESVKKIRQAMQKRLREDA